MIDSYPERKASVDKISSLSAASSRCPTALRARGFASKTLVNNSRTMSACWSMLGVRKAAKSSKASYSNKTIKKKQTSFQLINLL